MKNSSPGRAVAVAAVLLVLYAPTLFNIYLAYVAPSSFYTHGFLVPAACFFLYRERRERLLRAPPGSSGAGVVLIVLGCLLHIFGLRASVSVASGLSILVVIIGLALYHRGGLYTRELLPVLGILLFMIPLPESLLYQLTFSMKMAAAALGSSISEWLGLPVSREGIYITLPSGLSFAIEDPCSGLRSVVALSAISYVLAVLAPVTIWRKWLIFLAAVPLAWAGNLARVVATICLAYFVEGSAGSAAPHALVGFGSFLVSLLLLLLWSNWLIWEKRKAASR